MPYFEGTKGVEITNSNLYDIQGNATFNLIGDGPLDEDLKDLLVDHLTGVVAAKDLCGKLEKHTLSQSICNLPRANAAYNDYTSKDKKHTTCFENTRQALLKEAGEWIVAILDRPEIYLLSGLAGIGKSTVAQTVAERADNLHLLGASFFFSRDEADRRNAAKFYTTIAFQLCNYDEQFAQAIGDMLLKKGAAATSQEPMEQLEALIVEPLRHLVNQRSRPLVLVVDALDECDEEDGLIVLATLEHLVHELPSFRVVLTSRPRPRFEDFFHNHRVFHMHNIEDKVVDDDIRRYLKYRLSWEQVKRHLKLRNHWCADEHDIETLVRAAGRLFIIASTAVLFILDTVARNPASQISYELPGGSSSLLLPLFFSFSTQLRVIPLLRSHLVRAAGRLFIIASTAVLFILDTVARNPASQIKKLRSAFAQDRTPFKALNEFYNIILRSAVPIGCDRDIVERYRAVIGSIIVAQDPLPLETLANLIGSGSEDIRAVLDNLQPVILLGSNDVPRIYHKSFLDYVTDAECCKDDDLRIIPRDQHSQITICCLHVMNTHLKRNILELGTPSQFMENSAGLKVEGISDDQVGKKISSELRYACIYWANHFGVASTEDANVIEETGTFATNHLLHWFETLSWINKLGLAHQALLVLRQLLKPTHRDMYNIFSDAWRFISQFYDAIRRSALHTYHSALPFTPSKTLLYETYIKDMPNLRQLKNGPERWDALIATWNHEGERFVDRIVFSLDGSHIASWTETEIKLCDARSGTPVKTLKGDKVAIAGDFSVVALSQDSTLTLYHVARNTSVASFKHIANVIELALSFDGARMAVGLSNGTVSLWDKGTRESIASLGSYSDIKSWPALSSADYHLVFSPSSHHLAFLSDDGNIQLWNGFDGEPIASLSYELEKLVNFIFSRTGSRLAALTEKSHVHSLRLWNAESGEFIASAQIDRCPWGALAISDDDSLIATGGENRVQLWSAGLSRLYPLNIGQQIRSLAISRDMLAIGSLVAATLYDLKTHAIIAKLRSSFPTPFALSHDCTRFATTRGEAVHLWDVPSLKLSASSPAQQPRIVTAFAFSPDCLRLASGLKDGTIELWDMRCPEQMIATLKFHSKKITALAFSPDGEQLASGSKDTRVRLLGRRDGVPCGVLQHHFRGLLTSLAFSSVLLAAATYDDITLWDRKTLHLVHKFHEGSDCLSFSSENSRLASASGWLSNLSSATVLVRDVETYRVTAQLEIDSSVKRLVLSPDGSRLGITRAPFQGGGFNFFNLINKDTIINPGREEISCVLPNGFSISRSDEKVMEYGQRVLGHFPGHWDGVTVFWIPRDVNISAFTAESSMFALACDDGRVIIGRVPPASST